MALGGAWKVPEAVEWRCVNVHVSRVGKHLGGLERLPTTARIHLGIGDLRRPAVGQ
jgi:hypothetical protein